MVLTVGYDQYLLQDETEEGAKRWLMCIQNIIYKLVSLKLYVKLYSEYLNQINLTPIVIIINDNIVIILKTYSRPS